MKATGIVRRIDELGRVVIPKEIRKNFKIREGDPLEIYTDREGEIILKKYSPVGEIGELANELAEAVSQVTGNLVVVTDRDQIVAIAGGVKKENMGKRITVALEGVLEERKTITKCAGKKNEALTDNDEYREHSQVISPIIADSDVIGSVIMYAKDKENELLEEDKKMSMVTATVLGRQKEIQ